MKGQIWIETVLYTLIGLVLIGLVLAFVNPKIKEKQDNLAIEQAMASLDSINSLVGISPGNTREIFVVLKRGELNIGADDDTISIYFNDLNSLVSEKGIKIQRGEKYIISEEGQKLNSALIWLNYSGRKNITYNGNDDNKKFTKTATQYRFLISNKDDLNGDGIDEIDITEASGK